MYAAKLSGSKFKVHAGCCLHLYRSRRRVASRLLLVTCQHAVATGIVRGVISARKRRPLLHKLWAPFRGAF